MAFGTSVRLPKLRNKLLVLYAYSDIRSDADLAKRIGVSSGTLSGYLSGTQTSRAEYVPQAAREKLAELLVDILRSVSLADARALWLSENVDLFARAFQTIGDLSLTEVLTKGSRAPMIRYLPGGDEELRGIFWPRSGGTANAGNVRLAEIGDTFALRVEGTPKAWLLVLVAAADGRSLAPGPEQLDELGEALVPPDLAVLPQFLGLPGPHRFVAITTTGPRPVSLTRRNDPETPIESWELTRLAQELSDPEHVQTWCYDTLIVQVSPTR